MMNQFYCRKEQFLLEAVPAVEAAPSKFDIAALRAAAPVAPGDVLTTRLAAAPPGRVLPSP
ncbi:hypothetical protein [uncultured Dysosmobacter sp.]|uniref:hypothetical protein n=1 Tax=uncultured Dysosmobacter sp. TaxID=2591384 RepID=UPI0026389FE4|nr:hypothetical protein [uncultured Dysosmobacter sp.]